MWRSVGSAVEGQQLNSHLLCFPHERGGKCASRGPPMWTDGWRDSTLEFCSPPSPVFIFVIQGIIRLLSSHQLYPWKSHASAPHLSRNFASYVVVCPNSLVILIMIIAVTGRCCYTTSLFSLSPPLRLSLFYRHGINHHHHPVITIIITMNFIKLYSHQ